MNNILIGNGVNIQFGGYENTNESIVKRALLKLETGNYSDNIYTKEIHTWIKILFQILPEILEGKYDQYAVMLDEKEELEHFKNSYSKSTKIHEIGFEDFFLMSELYCRKNKIGNPERYNFQEFLRRLFLDSIYNSGKINDIYLNLPSSFIDYIKSFDNVFTTNYDRNIEVGANKEVFYLHGAFHVLDDVYNPNSLRNQLSDKPVEKTPVIKGYEHIFSTALTGNSGALKQFSGDISELTNSALEKFANGMINKPEIAKEIEKWKDTDSPIIKNLYEAIKLKTSKPELKVTQAYSINQLKEITGNITFIGLSSNNDSHIFSNIRNNDTIEIIEYYYFNETERSSVISLLKSKHIITKNVKDFWKTITSP